MFFTNRNCEERRKVTGEMDREEGTGIEKDRKSEGVRNELFG